MVKGLRKLNRQLKRIPVFVVDETRDAMELGAAEIVAMAKKLVPVGESRELQDSIGWTWGEPPKYSIVLATSRPSSKNYGRITIYAGNYNAFWARWIEFGTQNMAAQPYFLPSYRLLKRKVKSRITRKMNKAIKKAIK